MPPKRTSAASTPIKTSSSTSSSTTSSSYAHTKTTTTTSTSTSTSSSRTHPTGPKSAQEIYQTIYDNYVQKTPQRTKLLDAFMAFLLVVGALQFVYCVIAGNYPFNAFLAGFSATVGQFVLTASLRIQTNVENKADFEGVSHERAFADFVFGSMILHFFCVNFIN